MSRYCRGILWWFMDTTKFILSNLKILHHHQYTPLLWFSKYFTSFWVTINRGTYIEFKWCFKEFKGCYIDYLWSDSLFHTPLQGQVKVNLPSFVRHGNWTRNHLLPSPIPEYHYFCVIIIIYLFFSFHKIHTNSKEQSDTKRNMWAFVPDMWSNCQLWICQWEKASSSPFHVIHCIKL